MLFSNKDLKKLIIPLLLEQTLAITVGMADTIMANASDIGNAAHTPLSPQCGDSRNNNGIRNIICLVRLKKMDFAAMPSDWKKLVDTI